MQGLVSDKAGTLGHRETSIKGRRSGDSSQAQRPPRPPVGGLEPPEVGGGLFLLFEHTQLRLLCCGSLGNPQSGAGLPGRGRVHRAVPEPSMLPRSEPQDSREPPPNAEPCWLGQGLTGPLQPPRPSSQVTRLLSSQTHLQLSQIKRRQCFKSTFPGAAMSGQLAQSKNLCHAHPATLRSQRTWAGGGSRGQTHFFVL